MGLHISSLLNAPLPGPSYLRQSSLIQTFSISQGLEITEAGLTGKDRGEEDIEYLGLSCHLPLSALPHSAVG